MKSLSVEMSAHIQQGVTTLATCMTIRRRDGATFCFTDHDQPLSVGAQIFLPYYSYSRTSIPTTVELEVDTMELKGVLNSGAISRADIASGMYDYSEISMFAVNWQDPSSGQIGLRTGWAGEIVSNEDGTFNCEVRGLTQVFAYRIGEAYQPECQADLGDLRCKVKLLTDDATALWQPNTAYTQGDTVQGVISAASNFVNLDIVNNSFDNDGAVELERNVDGWNSYGDARGRWTITDNFFNLKSVEGQAVYGTDDRSIVGNPEDGSTGIGMYQNVNLVTSGVPVAAIDTGLCRLYSTLYYGFASTKGSAQYRVMALDANTNQIGAGAIYDSGTKTGSVDVFNQMIVKDVLLPVGTRYLRFDLYTTKLAKWTEGAGFDTLTAAINLPNGTYGSKSLYGGVVQVAQNSGTSGATSPAFTNEIGATITDNNITWKVAEGLTTVDTVATISKGNTMIVPADTHQPDGWFDGGLLIWETGANAGAAQEVKTWLQGALTFFYAPYYAITVGDRFALYPGCDKLLTTCNTKFNNVNNFRGMPWVPGQDAYYTTPNAPSS